MVEYTAEAEGELEKKKIKFTSIKSLLTIAVNL